MRESTQTSTSTVYNTEWKSMANDVLKNSELSDHPALNRLQLHAQEEQDDIDIGCYSKMHHRHNRG